MEIRWGGLLGSVMSNHGGTRQSQSYGECEDCTKRPNSNGNNRPSRQRNILESVSVKLPVRKRPSEHGRRRFLEHLYWPAQPWLGTYSISRDNCTTDAKQLKLSSQERSLQSERQQPQNLVRRYSRKDCGRRGYLLVRFAKPIPCRVLPVHLASDRINHVDRRTHAKGPPPRQSPANKSSCRNWPADQQESYPGQRPSRARDCKDYDFFLERPAVYPVSWKSISTNPRPQCAEKQKATALESPEPFQIGRRQ